MEQPSNHPDSHLKNTKRRLLKAMGDGHPWVKFLCSYSLPSISQFEGVCRGTESCTVLRHTTLKTTSACPFPFA